ncbi:hypothetical protein H2202_006328 [Exophiala xenobiotica]|nr:hypothetical protein H2202_006328 [Exophiala xenobiotica]
MPSIPSIQANLVLALFEALSSSESLAWMYSGLAIRMALAMRLTQEYHEAQSPQEKEAREDLRSPFTLLAMLSAASVLLWSRFAAEEDMTISTGAQQCNRVKLIFDLFKAWASQWRMALACSGTLEIVCVLYEVAYTGVQGTTFMQSSLSFNHYPTGSDEEEVSRQYHSHCGDGYPDVVTMNQRFYDKIRMVLLGPLNQPKLKEAIMHIFLSTMWQHSWISRNLTAIDTLFLSSPGGGEPLLNEESTTTTAGG